MLIVGPNLSVDQTVAVTSMRVGAIHRVPEILRLAGGKGTNLARALRTLGEDPLLCGFVGGPTGAAYTAYLGAEGIRHHLVPTQADTRVCFSIADEASGKQTEFYEAGMPVAETEIKALVACASAHMDRMRAGEWVALTGSLPRGAPDDLYARLTILAHQRQMRVLLDAREPALGPAIAAAPDMIKINQDELAAWAHESHAERATEGAHGAANAEIAHIAQRALSDRAGGGVVITLGARGAVAVSAAGGWRISPPATTVRSPVGSGDSAAAGLLVGLRRGLSLAEAARLAVAAGTANAGHLGAGRFAAAEVEALAPRCVVVAIAG